jgi:hypothetical protein
MKLDPRAIQHEIHNLLATNPELAEDDQLRADMVEGETDAFDFLSMLTRKIGENTSLAVGTDLYISTLKERNERIYRRIEAFRALAFKIMCAADLKKAELPEATLSIRSGAPRVIITDEAALPDSACRIKREPDKTKIKELLQDGSVPGAVLSNAEPVLSIRTR